ncbi:Methyltransferase [Methanocaldococcus bathoardescens]|uniref:Methyltransferase n=1 Tax=Methanocaldococcus bathoardescens TaxID=1301915 RepID=A0A076LII4_9EURY|nr:class I SAM-dependent methyltransferase [Methanocaldococcus bathoardescens]AIJ05324.1 Methyltransferase [Methanocaldococcus bathoardescens]
MGIKEYYDKLAKSYDKLYKNKYMRVVEKEIIKKEIKDDDFVLDIGCGTGEQLKILNKAVGLDISIEMAKIANKKTNKLIVVANAEFIPFKNKSFDKAISFFGALNHCNINRALREVNRVLKDNGVFIFTVANIYDIKWIIKNILKGNFKKVRKALKKRKGTITKVIEGEKIKVKTRFYDFKEVEEALRKEGFEVVYTFGANITNSPLDKFIYKSFLKNFASYIGFVAKKVKNK